jgi:hypothetical protein
MTHPLVPIIGEAQPWQGALFTTFAGMTDSAPDYTLPSNQASTAVDPLLVPASNSPGPYAYH